MKSDLSISPIGKLVSPLTQKFGVPRQPNLVAVPATIELYAPYDQADAVKGLEQFSHIWVIWQFHAIKDDSTFRPVVRPPRLGGNAKIGVFASRSMFRPNRMGMSVVMLDKVVVEKGVATLHVLGADMVDGTPILDIKPYISYSDSVPNAHSGYATEAPQPKAVIWTDDALASWALVLQQGSVTKADKAVISQLIAQDPRPAYQTQSNSKDTHNNNKTYTMRYRQIDVVFYADGDTLVICDIVSVTLEKQQ